MDKKIILTTFISLFFISLVSSFPYTININNQVEDSGVIKTGTFLYNFSISAQNNCASPIYSYQKFITTDSRGIFTETLPSVTMDFSLNDYYLCVYRDGILKSNRSLSSVPYSFYSLKSNYSSYTDSSNKSDYLDGYDSSYFYPYSNPYNFINTTTRTVSGTTDGVAYFNTTNSITSNNLFTFLSGGTGMTLKLKNITLFDGTVDGDPTRTITLGDGTDTPKMQIGSLYAFGLIKSAFFSISDKYEDSWASIYTIQSSGLSTLDNYTVFSNNRKGFIFVDSSNNLQNITANNICYSNGTGCVAGGNSSWNETYANGKYRGLTNYTGICQSNGTGCVVSLGDNSSFNETYTDGKYLKLDQSTAQTITASPILNWGTSGRIPFYDSSKKLNDSSLLTFNSTGGLLTVTGINTTDGITATGQLKILGVAGSNDTGSGVNITAGQGGNGTSSTGVTGGGVTMVSGLGGTNGGAAASFPVGGAGGPFTFLTGNGGNSITNCSGFGSNTGGAGGAFTITTGTGGLAQNACGLIGNAGGAGGAFTATLGNGGAARGSKQGGLGGAGSFTGGTGGIANISGTFTTTITIATPAVLTSSSANGYGTASAIIFSTDGALPTGITAGTTYYTVPINSTSYNLATSITNAQAGTPLVATSGTQSGTHTAKYATNIGGAGGAFTFTGGTGGAAANAVTTTGGAGGGFSFIGGLGGAPTAGTTNNAGSGGSIVIRAGTGGASTTGGTGGSGGQVTIQSGMAGSVTSPSVSGSSGSVTIAVNTFGTSGVGGNAGSISIQGAAGNDHQVAGVATQGGTGSSVTLTAGNGGLAALGTTNTGGNGGTITLISGLGGTGSTANGMNGAIIFKNLNTEYARFANGSSSLGFLGIGTGEVVSAKLHVISLTEQLRLGYDTSNYYSTTVGSTGIVTYDAFGTSSRFDFLDNVTMPAARIGNSTSNITIDKDNAIRFNGDATFFEDVVAPLTVSKTGATSPSFDENARAYGFADGVQEQYTFVSLQIPHSYKQGSNIGCHIHVRPDGTQKNNVTFEMNYSWFNVWEANTSTTSLTVSQNFTSGIAYNNTIIDFGQINGAGKTISSTLTAKITRKSNVASDTYTGSVFVDFFDCHVERDSLGSNQEYIK